MFISFLIMIAFSIWNFHIYWYWIFYVVGFLITYFFLKWIWKKKFFVKQKNVQDILEHSLEDLLIYLILWVLIGGRLWEVFIYQWPYFSQHLLEIFAVWHGWMSFVWWITWVLLAVLIFIRVKKLTFSDFVILLSLLCVVAPFAIMLGRFGNYLNQELYGIMIPQLFLESHESLSAFLAKINIFHTYDLVDQNLRLNTNFLAIIFEWLIPFIIWLVLFTVQLKRKKFKLFLNMGIFLILYSTARFVLEYFRVESQTQLIWWFTKSQRIFIVAFIISIRRKLLNFNRWWNNYIFLWYFLCFLKFLDLFISRVCRVYLC